MRGFMKKIVVLLLFMFLALPAVSKQKAKNPEPPEEPAMTYEAAISFDWITKTQLQRDENIKQIQDMLFSEGFKPNYSKKEFKEAFKDNWKDKDNFQHYETVNSGVTEDANNFYCGFFKSKVLVVYGVQHKSNMKNKYYYDAMGGLRWIDLMSDKYPEFPYWSYQYYRNGKLVAAYYNLSDYDQYIFDANKKFLGRAYKENIYNRNAKVIMTRSNFWDK